MVFVLPYFSYFLYYKEKDNYIKIKQHFRHERESLWFLRDRSGRTNNINFYNDSEREIKPLCGRQPGPAPPSWVVLHDLWSDFCFSAEKQEVECINNWNRAHVLINDLQLLLSTPQKNVTDCFKTKDKVTLCPRKIKLQ